MSDLCVCECVDIKLTDACIKEGGPLLEVTFFLTYDYPFSRRSWCVLAVVKKRGRRKTVVCFVYCLLDFLSFFVSLKVLSLVPVDNCIAFVRLHLTNCSHSFSLTHDFEGGKQSSPFRNHCSSCVQNIGSDSRWCFWWWVEISLHAV